MMRKLLVYLKSLLQGKYVGCDIYGNKYYEDTSSKRFFGRNSRWIYYKSYLSPQHIPASWHNWLHHQCEAAPIKSNEKFSIKDKKPAQVENYGRSTANCVNLKSYEAWVPNSK